MGLVQICTVTKRIWLLVVEQAKVCFVVEPQRREEKEAPRFSVLEKQISSFHCDPRKYLMVRCKLFAVKEAPKEVFQSLIVFCGHATVAWTQLL